MLVEVAGNDGVELGRQGELGRLKEVAKGFGKILGRSGSRVVVSRPNLAQEPGSKARITAHNCYDRLARFQTGSLPG